MLDREKMVATTLYRETAALDLLESNEIIETTLTTTIHTFRTPYIQRNQRKVTVLQTLWQETLEAPFA